MYLAPEPVKELEDWFLSILRPAFDESVFVIITYKEDEELEPVPYDYIKIIFTGVSTNVLEKYSEQYFNFKLVYSCHLPATLMPHRRVLALLEKGRKALWEKIPPRPAQAYPLLLKAEKIIKSKNCECGPAYSQEWQAYNRVQGILVPFGDPCQGEGEPNSVIPNPNDYITPLPNDPDNYYVRPNPNYDPNSPITNGTNQPYIYDPNTGTWTINPNYNPCLPTTWGNLPFILSKFIKSVSIIVKDKASNTTLYEA